MAVAVGVSVVLVAAVLILISVTVCLRQRKKQELLITTGSAAYGTSQVNMELKDNIAYTSTVTGEGTKDDDEIHDVITTGNAAYGTSQVNVELKDNIAYTSAATGEGTKDDDAVYDNIDDIIYDYVSMSDATATPSNVPVAVNQAYGVVQS